MSIHYSHVAIAVSTALLFGCGGGSDSDSTTVTPAPPPAAQVSAISTQLVSGQITSDSGTAIEMATVTLVFQNSSNDTLVELSTTTDAQGFYSVSVPDLKATEHQADELIITVEKLGYVLNEKSVDIGENSGLVQANATLATAQVATVKREDLESIAISANGVPSLMFSLVKNSKGEQRVVVGEVSPAADEDVQLAVSLPVANIDENVEVINSEVAYFDSSDADDIQSFPGDFVGQGNTDNQGQGVSFEQQDSSEEYRLISSTFSQIKLTDEDQNPLPLSDVQASNGESPSIIMMVPKGSYPTIQRDFDESVDGIQIPIYVYRSGQGWQYVGNGLLVSDSAGNTPVTEDDIPIDGDGNITLTGDETIQLYVKVEITEANEWISWINLDWPIKTGDSIGVCLKGSVSYRNGENYYGYAYIELPDGGSEWLYISDGAYEMNLLLFGSGADLLDGTKWSFSVYNNKSYQYEYATLPALLVQSSDSDTECANMVDDLLLSNPYACKLEGHTYEADGTTALPYNYVTIQHERGYNYAFSDVSGYYQQSVLCDSALTAEALGQVKSATVTSAELVETLNFSDANRPPLLGALIRGSTSITVDDQAELIWSVSDPDGDDVDVTLTCVDSATNDPANCSNTQSGTSATFSFDSPAAYEITIAATDNQPREAGVSDPQETFTIKVRDSDNIAPEIIAFEHGSELFAAGDEISVREGDSVLIGAITRDLNGDALSHNWTGGCVSATATSCDLSVPAVGDYPLELTVTDDHSSPLSTTAGVTVKVQQDNAPVIDLLTANPTNVRSDGSDNIEPVSLVALLSDDFTATGSLSLAWSLFNGDDQDVTSLLGGASGSSIVLPVDTLPVDTYRVELMVTDDAASPNTTTQTASFEVLENIAPTVSLSADPLEFDVLQGGSVDSPVIITASLADDEGVENLTLSWSMSKNGSDLSAELSLSDNQQSATIAANTLTAGSYEVSLTATDAHSASSTATLILTVEEDSAPVIRSLTVSPQIQTVSDASQVSASEFVLQVVATDDKDSAPTIEWSFSPSVSATIDGDMAIIPAGLAVGEYQATVTVTDSQGQSSQQSTDFSVLVSEGNIVISID